MNLLDLLFQIAGLLLLFGGIGLGYRRWIKPHGAVLDTRQRCVLLLLIMTLVGGFVGSPIWWIDDPRGFAWDLPPLASRMLAAAGWSFVVLCHAALHRPTSDRIRLVLAMLAVYLAPLAGAILIWHLDRFDLSAPVTYAFFTIVSALLLPTAWFLAQPPRPIVAHSAEVPLAEPIMSLWLVLVGIVTGLWGLALFVTDQGPTELIWAWPGDLLTSRLIGVMLLTIMTGAMLGRHTVDLGRIVLRVTIIYAIGLTVASLWGLLVGQPLRPGYAIAFAIIAIGSALTLRVGIPASGGTA